MKFRSVLAASVALACLSTVALASGVQFRGTGTIGDVAQDAERITLQFAPRTNVLLGGTVVSDVVRYDGPNLAATVSGGQVRVCPTSACGSDGGWVSSTQVKAGQFVQLRRAGPQAAGATVTAALEIAGQRFAFDATARSQAPSFGVIASVTAEPGVSRDSDLSTFVGWVEAPIAVTGGEYRVCASQGSCGPFTTAPGTIRDGDQVQLRVVAGAFGESRTASVAAGGGSASFKVDVRARDTSPDAFALGTGPTGVEPGSVSTSQAATLAGFDDAPISVSGTGATYSVNGGSFTAVAGTAKTGDVVRIQLIAGAFGETRTAMLDVGDVKASFSVATRSRDTAPDAVTFPSLTEQTAGAVVVSAVRRLTGHDGVTVTVSGTGAEIRTCSTSDCVGGTVGAWSTSVAVATDAYVQLRTTAGAAGATVSASLAYGAATSATWSVATKAAPAIENWYKTVGGTSADTFNGLTVASDGAIIGFGQTASAGTATDGLVARYSADGTLVSQRIYGGANFDQIRGAVATPGGYLDIAGSTQSASQGSFDGMLFRTTSSGGVSWGRAIATIDTDFMYGLSRASDGALYGVGYTAGLSSNTDGIIAKYTADGTYLWQRSLSSTGGGADYLSGVATAKDGTTYAAGSVTRNGQVDALLASYAYDGTLVWQRSVGHVSQGDDLASVAVADDGSVYVVGGSFGSGNNDVYIAKFSSTGSILWQRRFLGAGNDSGSSIAILSDGSIVVAGTSFGIDSSGEMFVARITATGNLVWQRSFGKAGAQDRANGIAVGKDGAIYVAGGTMSTGAGSQDAILVKLKPDGTGIGPIGVMSYAQTTLEFFDTQFSVSDPGMTQGTSGLVASTYTPPTSATSLSTGGAP